MRSTKAWQMEASSFETTVASMVSVQVCTYHYLFMCTQALTYGGRVLGTGQKESNTAERKDEDKEKRRVTSLLLSLMLLVVVLLWIQRMSCNIAMVIMRKKSLIRSPHEAIYG